MSCVGADERSFRVERSERQPDETARHRGKFENDSISVGKAVGPSSSRRESALDDRHRRGSSASVFSRASGSSGALTPPARSTTVDALLGEPLDDLLAELAQRDPIEQRVRVLLEQPRDVALGRVESSREQVRSREMEEGQRMRLYELGAVEQFAQLLGAAGDAHGHDCVARLRRGSSWLTGQMPQMRDVIDGIS